MSKLQTTPGTTVVLPQPAGTSGFAIAGLIFSILGWLTCGLLCIIGAPLSFLALFDRGPKGVAIAGLIVGFPGIVFFILVGAGFFLAALGIGVAAKNQADMQNQVTEQQGENAETENSLNPPVVEDDASPESEGMNQSAPPTPSPSAPTPSTPAPPAFNPSTPDPPPARPATDEKENDERKEVRVWTDSQGKFTVEATFSGIADKKDVFLKKNDGKVIRVSIDKLSEEDKEWLKTNAKWKPSNEDN
jgi:hypothetical protein